MNDQQMCAIAQIFVNNPIGAERFKEPLQWDHKKLEKANWHNAVLKEMEQFGFNHIEYIRPSDSDKKYKPKGDVNINRYCILRPLYFRETILTTIYPEERDWSHPIVKALFEAMRDGSLKKFLDDRVLWSLYEPIKLFVNTTSQAARSHLFNFNFWGGFNWNRYGDAADIYLDVILAELDESANFAFVYNNDIFLDSDRASVKAKFDNAQIPLLEFVGEDDRLLNKACRAYQIDIVKDIMTS